MSEHNPETFLSRLFGLKGKVAVVVGGTGVLCGEMAHGLLQAGCKVCLVGRSREKANQHIKAWGTDKKSVMFQPADVTSRMELKSALEAVCEQWGRIDIWINGAGINSATPYLDISDEEFQSILDVNLKAVHLACQLIGGHWLDKKQPGNIINISSLTSLLPLSRVFTYSLTKAAVLNLTRNLAREWANDGIRVNALCPGFFPAEQNRIILDESRVRDIMRGTPMNRFGESHELVGAVLLLASDMAGSFITGENLVVDGGFSINTI